MAKIEITDNDVDDIPVCMSVGADWLVEDMYMWLMCDLDSPEDEPLSVVADGRLYLNSEQVVRYLNDKLAPPLSALLKPRQQ